MNNLPNISNPPVIFKIYMYELSSKPLFVHASY